MEKSLHRFISKLQNGVDFTAGHIALKNLRGGLVPPVDNGSCTNGDCTGTNTSVCTNTADCTHATNSIPSSCTNIGGPGCCG
jgi:hypothetical protein